jgi:hypothetical protein
MPPVPVRLTLLTLFVIFSGCSKPAPAPPAPSPAPTPAPAPAEQPKQPQSEPEGGGADRGAEDRAAKYLQSVGARYEFNDYGKGRHLSHIYLMGAKATDERVRECLVPTLHYIDLGETPVTDQTLERLGALPELTNLHISSPKATDAGAAHLAGAKTLISVYLTECSQVTDAGIQNLATLPELIDLVVVGTKVTDAGVAAFKKVKPKCLVMK